MFKKRIWKIQKFEGDDIVKPYKTLNNSSEVSIMFDEIRYSTCQITLLQDNSVTAILDRFKNRIEDFPDVHATPEGGSSEASEGSGSGLSEAVNEAEQ